MRQSFLPVFTKSYVNDYLRIDVRTDSVRIGALIDRFMDFCVPTRKKPRMRFKFDFCEPRGCGDLEDSRFLYQSFLKEDSIIGSLAGEKVRFKVNSQKGVVRVWINDYQESEKERLLDFGLMRPLMFLLAHRGYFPIHASTVAEGKDGILICGPKNTGKSSLALMLSQSGFDLLSDDDCFVRHHRGGVQLYPFGTKIGLHDPILKRFPVLERHTIKNWRYGGKRRVSLSCIARTMSSPPFGSKMLIFPRYKADQNLRFRRISPDEALRKLMNENIHAFWQRETFKSVQKEMFLTFFPLVKNAAAYEMVYHDEHFGKIAEKIHRLGNHAGGNRRYEFSR